MYLHNGGKQWWISIHDKDNDRNNIGLVLVTRHTINHVFLSEIFLVNFMKLILDWFVSRWPTKYLNYYFACLQLEKQK